MYMYLELVIGEGMMTYSRNQSLEDSKVPFRESESLKDNVNRCMGAFCHSMSY